MEARSIFGYHALAFSHRIYSSLSSSSASASRGGRSDSCPSRYTTLKVSIHIPTTQIQHRKGGLHSPYGLTNQLHPNATAKVHARHTNTACENFPTVAP